MIRIAALLLVAQTAFAAAVTPAEYQARRARPAKEIGPNAMLIVFSALTSGAPRSASEIERFMQ